MEFNRIEKFDSKNFYKTLNKITSGMIEIEQSIIEGKADYKLIHHNIYQMRKIYLRTEMAINKKILSGQVQKSDVREILQKLRLIGINLKFLDKYYNNVLQVKQKQSLDSLTLVTLIFLPLTLITGYFGMNFKDMGSPSIGQGVFTWKKGQHFVFSLFIISIVIILILVRIGIIYG